MADPQDRAAGPNISIEVLPGALLDDQISEEVNSVLQKGFGGWPRAELRVSPIEHLRWKALGPTERGADVCLVRLDSGRIIGAQILFSRRYHWEGRELHVIEGVDAVLDPSAQGKGISSRRSQQLQRDYEPDFDLAMSFASNPIVVGSRIRRGSRQLQNDVRQLTRVLSIRDAFAAPSSGRNPMSPALLRTAGLIGFRIWAALRRRPSAPSAAGTEICEVDLFDDRVDALFDVFAGQFDFIQVRDQRALNWRYADPRGGDYKIAIAEAGGRLHGYVVYRTSFGRAFIMDMITSPGGEGTAAVLLEHAISRVRALGATSVTTWVQSEHPHRETYRRQGFLDTRSNPGFALRAIRMNANDLAPLYGPGTRVHVTLGDADFL